MREHFNLISFSSWPLDYRACHWRIARSFNLQLDKLNNKSSAERCNNLNVIPGELPAAVHDGNGVSRAFLNLWLVHLTMSYVFTR